MTQLDLRGISMTIDELTADQLDIIAEMAENNGYSILGAPETKQQLQSLGLLEQRPEGGWKFTDQGELMAAEYHRRGKAGTLPKRSDQ